MKNKCLSDYIYSIATSCKVCLMFVNNWAFTFKIGLAFAVILVVKTLDSQYRIPDSNLLGGFKIKVISVFHPVEVD